MSQSSNPIISKVATLLNDESYYYVGVQGSPFASECTVIGLNAAEISALRNRYPNSGNLSDTPNAAMIRVPPFSIINALAELGYRVVCSTGGSEVLWTLQREV